MLKTKGKRYSVTLPSPVEKDLNQLTDDLGITKAEILRRSIMLYKHAVKAETVELHGKDGKSQKVLLK